jgi:hypothetical protein
MSLPLSPQLAQDQTGFDCLAQADLIRKDHAAAEWRPKREAGCIDLVRVQIDGCVEE